MYNIIYVFTAFVHAFLGVLQFLMLIRAVMSWFPIDGEESHFSVFVHMITEPAILPVRWVFDRFGNFDELPLDIPFFVTVILLMMLQTMLPVVTI